MSRSSMCLAKVPWKKKDRREITEARTSRHEPGGRRDQEGRIETPNSFARLKSRSHE